MIAATIENNTADRGGGIYNGGTLTLIASTVAGNVTNPAATSATTLSGGGIDNSGSLDLIDSTIADNSADNGSGGGVFDESSGTATVQGTIIATNTGQYGSPDVAGAFVSLGQNLVGNPAGSTGFIATHDLQNRPTRCSARLMLQGVRSPDDGGSCPTGSPAIDAGAANPSATLTIPGVFAQYPADGNANDVTGGHNGTIEGGVTYAPGVVGQAFPPPPPPTGSPLPAPACLPSACLCFASRFVFPVCSSWLQFNGQFGLLSSHYPRSSTDIVGNRQPSPSPAWIKTTSDGDIIEQRDANNFNGEYDPASGRW